MKTITIIGKRWFDKINGNTYHSSIVYINGEEIDNVPFTYGYGDHYRQTAFEILKEHNILTDQSYYTIDDLKKHGYNIVCNVSDVGRKRDL